MKFKKIRITETNNPVEYHLRSPIQITNITLRHAIIPNVSYLINNNNHTFYYNSTSVDLDNGNYNIQELITMLKAKLSAIITDITFNSNNYKLTFTFNASVNVKWDTHKQLSRILGFDTTAINSASQTSNNAIDLSNQYYQIKIEELANMDENPNYSYDIIPNSVAYGNILYYNRDKLEYDEMKYNYKYVNKLTISIRDQQNNLCDFNNHSYLLEFDVCY